MSQVVEERIQHICWSPASPEPYYASTRNELRPQPVGEDAGTVIFQYYPMSAVNYVSNAKVYFTIHCTIYLKVDTHNKKTKRKLDAPFTWSPIVSFCQK
jgi:hypothetical protein